MRRILERLLNGVVCFFWQNFILLFYSKSYIGFEFQKKGVYSSTLPIFFYFIVKDSSTLPIFFYIIVEDSSTLPNISIIR
jgi:hypothetical protein